MTLTKTLDRASPADAPDAMLLVAELEHRIANEFAFVIASISIAASRSPNPETKAALAEISERLLDHAEVHRALQPPLGVAPVALSAYLQRLCGALVRASLRRRCIELTIREDDVELDPARCWRVGLIVAELINNVVKHRLDATGGAIVVEVRRNGGMVTCRVSDNGRSGRKVGAGRGGPIVESLIAELGGRIRRTFTEQGSSVVLAFPSHASGRSPTAPQGYMARPIGCEPAR